MRLAALGALCVLAFAALGVAWGMDVLGREGPEVRVARYVEAVARGDEAGALAAWPEPKRTSTGKSELERTRRAAVTHELIAARVTAHRVVATEWWRTCCEPGLAARPEDAGLARLRVELITPEGAIPYTFDVRDEREDPNATWERHRWALRDAYPPTKQPIDLPWVLTPSGGCHSESFDPRSPTCPVAWPPRP